MAKLSVGLTAFILAGIGLAFTNAYCADKEGSKERVPPEKAQETSKKDGDGSTDGKRKREGAKKANTRGKPDLSKKVSFEYVDMPLKDVLADLTRQTGIVFRMSSSSPKWEDIPQINLAVDEMACSTALTWILRLAGLSWKEKDGVVVISGGKSSGRLQTGRLRMEER